MAEEILGGEAPRPTSKGTRAILVRGAETSFLGKGVFPDKADRAGLTDNGKAQGERLSVRLTKTHEGSIYEIAAVYSAPSQGEQETAEIIVDGLKAKSSGLKVTTVEDLRAAETGVWAGMSKSAVAEKFPDDFKKWQENPTTFAPEGAETGVQVVERICPAITKILEQNKGKTVVFVMSSGALRLTVLGFLGLDLSVFADKIEQLPTAVNVIDFSLDGSKASARLLTLNDVSHVTEITMHDPTKLAMAATWKPVAMDDWDDEDLLDELRGAGGGGSSAFGDND